MTDPPWLTLAIADLGTIEGVGTKNNPKVVTYYRDSGHPEVVQDAVPWCAAAVGAWLSRAGRKPSGSLMARSYLYWGQKSKPMRGAVVVFQRGKPPSGHVAFYVRDNGNGTIRVVGGNQSDAVTIANYQKARVLGYRWPKEKTA